MEVSIKRVALLEAPATTVTSGNGYYNIPGLPPIKITEWAKQVDVVPAQAQVLKGTTITISQTVTADKIYKFYLNFRAGNRFGFSDQRIPVGTRTPGVLTGTAATDKHNIYLAWAYKVNRSSAKYSTVAYAEITIAYTSGTGNWAVGDTVTGSTSGATAKIIARSGAISASTNTLTLGIISGTFGTETITSNNSTTPGSATGGAPTLGVGLRLDDIGPYKVNQPIYTKLGQDGYHDAFISINDGLIASDIVVTTAPVTAFGQGADLVAMKPISEYATGNLARGNWNYPTNADPVSTSTYNAVFVSANVKADGAPALLDGASETGRTTIQYCIWIKNDATNYAAYVAALAALTN